MIAFISIALFFLPPDTLPTQGTPATCSARPEAPSTANVDPAATGPPRAMLGPPILSDAPLATGSAAAWPASAGFFVSPRYLPQTRSWVNAEYLLWWVKNAPASVPLVTRNNDPTTIGALTDPGTTIFLGAGSNRDIGFGLFSGARLTAGTWLDDEQRFGFEGGGFLLERRSFQFSAASAGGANPIVSIPFNATQPFNGNPSGETSLNAGGAPNTVNISTTSRLWGAEANGLLSFRRSDVLEVSGIVGFRYLDLTENLTSTDTFSDPTANGTVTIMDGFGTRNQFYGGQMGVRARWSFSKWSFDTTAKVALGDNHQTLNIAGATVVNGGAFGFANGTTPGGVFAEPSNIGQFHRDVFAVVPEVTFKVTYSVTPRVSTFVGYNFLYLSNSIRPGNEIDRNVNPTQNAFFVPPGILTGPAAPLPVFHSSNFWAQGINFGVELKF
jgi:hypothetical protein